MSADATETIPFVNCHNRIKNCKTFIMNWLFTVFVFVHRLRLWIQIQTKKNERKKGEMINAAVGLLMQRIWWMACVFTTINLKMWWNEETEAIGKRNYTKRIFFDIVRFNKEQRKISSLHFTEPFNRLKRKFHRNVWIYVGASDYVHLLIQKRCQIFILKL